MRVRTTQPNRTARFDWDDGATRVHAYFTAVNDGKSSLSMQHELLPNVRAANAAKALWKKRLTTLKASLKE